MASLWQRSRAVRSGVLAAFIAFACAGDRSRPGTLVISAAGDADILFPPVVSEEQAEQVTDLVFERLAEISPDLNTVGDVGWTPALAQRWEWSRDSMAVTFYLDPGARWHDGVPVRAPDVRFAFAVYTDPAVASSDGADIRGVADSISVGDSLTCTVWFKRRLPERFYTVVYNLVPLPEHLLGSIRHDSLATSPYARRPVGNGPYRMVRWKPGQRIEIAAVPDFHRGRPNVDRVIWTIVAKGDVAVARVFAGDADFIYKLNAADAVRISQYPALRSIHLGTSAITFAVFNQHDGASDRPHPILSDRAVRRALTMAVDRAAIISNVLDSLGMEPLGPASRQLWSMDSTLHRLPYDPAAAARLLDSAGWRVGANGMRARNGKPFAISVFVSQSTGERYHVAVLLQEQWKKIGVALNIEQIDQQALRDKMHAKQFDVALAQVGAAPSPIGLRQTWSSAAIPLENSLNSGRYSNPKLDALIDSAANAQSVAQARRYYHAAYQVLLDDAPGLWLYEPIVVAAANTRVQISLVGKRPWWTTIPAWRVAAGGAGQGGLASAQKTP